MTNLIRQLVKRTRSIIRTCGWDIVRYRPLWPTLLGVERLPIRTVLDIGAYDGDTARIFRRYFPQATIHSFEPQSKPYQSLLDWASTQDNYVSCHHFALGNKSGSTDLFTYPNQLRVSSFFSSTQTWVNNFSLGVPTMTPTELYRLDDIATNLSLTDEVLVKIDTEGYEKQVILGGMAVLRSAVACIVEVRVVERSPNQPSFREIIDLLQKANLQYGGNLYHGLRPTGTVGYFDAIFLRQDALQRPFTPAPERLPLPSTPSLEI